MKTLLAFAMIAAAVAVPPRSRNESTAATTPSGPRQPINPPGRRRLTRRERRMGRR